MNMETEFTRLIGCRVPVQLAGMGGMWTPELTAAVANAGGLGMMGAAVSPPTVLSEGMAQVRNLLNEDAKVGVNFLMPFVTEEAVELAAQSLDVVEFFYDQPDADLIKRVHQHEKLAGWQIGSVEEALAAQDTGCDYVVAQGVEAGGHVRGTVPLIELLDALVPKIRLPIVAAGGVSDGAGLARVIACGGHGVRVGTRFVTAQESAAHPQYVDALLKASEADTVLTEAYSVGWPNAPHRVLKSCVEQAERSSEPVGQMQIMGQTQDIPRFNVLPPDRSASGNVPAMCMYAGESVGNVHHRQAAAEIVDSIVAESVRLAKKNASP